MFDEQQLQQIASTFHQQFVNHQWVKIEDDKSDYHFAIYTDGSYSMKTHCGGWAVVVRLLEHQCQHLIDQQYITDNRTNSTNNRMEMMAMLNALRLIHRLSDDHRRFQQMTYTIYSDSEYVIETCLGGFHGKKNRDLIEVMINLYADIKHKMNIDLSLTKVDAHVSKHIEGIHHQINGTADRLANEARIQLEEKRKGV